MRSSLQRFHLERVLILTAPSAAGSITVAASPQAVYALITDLRVLADLAEETSAIAWHSGTAAAPGAVFRGTNRNGWRHWTTTCTVTDAEPGHLFGFDVRHTKVPIAHWEYAIEPTADGCRVTESMWDRRPRWMSVFGPLATGVSDRIAANSANIEATLGRLKQRAESVRS